MADFVAVLKKTLDGLPDPTPETRQRVYARAKATIVARIDAMSPPPPPSVREMQLRALDDAVKTVEQSYAPRKPLDPLDELEDVFRSLNGLMNQPATPAPKPATPLPPIATAPVASERPPIPERPRLDVQPRREAPPLPEAERLPPRAAPMPPRPAATAAPTMPPRLPPVRDPSRPVPGNVAPPIRESLRTPPPRDEFDDFNLDAASEDSVPPPARETRRAPEARRPIPPDQVAERRSGGFGKIAAVLLGLAALGGAGYGVWINKDDFSRLVGLTPPTETQPAQTDTPEPPPVETAAAPPAEAPPPAETPAAEPPPAAEPGKLTQRLNEDGSEMDMGPAAGEPAIGEGTSVAAATQPSGAAPVAPVTPPELPATPPAVEPPPATPVDPAATPADPAPPEAAVPPAADPAPAPPTDLAATTPPVDPTAPPANAAATPPTDPAAAPADPSAAPADPAVPPTTTAAAPAATGDGSVAVAQKAIFYEERTSAAEGSAEPGTTVWSLVQESPGGGRPPEPAIKGIISVPDRNVGISLTIRRNADPTLPASHIIEMIFITPENSTEGGVENILRVAFKSDEQQPGNPVIGLPAKIGDGFFLVALNNSKPEVDANMSLLQRQNWMDIAFVYKSGRRALITMEKGVPGEKVFSEALKAWGVASSG